MRRPHLENQEICPELGAITKRLCEYSLPYMPPAIGAGKNMPSPEKLGKMMGMIREIIFPGFYAGPKTGSQPLPCHVECNLHSIHNFLASQILAGLCFACDETENYIIDCEANANRIALQFMRELPHVRDMLISDAMAAYEGDPAATSPAEAIFCYPSMAAMLHHRVAHALYRLNVPLIPRMIAEMAHSVTGIDIHPGARIGKDFFIDHGTGVVIGETSVIGSGCRIYQGVTLGALSFPKNADGSLVKNIPRHPVLGNNITVYAGATILGRITIGDGSVIGGNTWITHDVPAGSKILAE